MKIFICKHCGNVIIKLTDSKVSVECCGGNMEELIANTTEAAGEKHIPIFKDGKVIVGEVLHPMTEEHYIDWIIVETEDGYVYKKIFEQPIADILETGIKSVYAYCNIHGLWKLNV